MYAQVFVLALQTVSIYMHSRPSINKLLRIAGAKSCDSDYLKMTGLFLSEVAALMGSA